MSKKSVFDRWYLTQEGYNFGPFSTTELVDLLSSGQVAATEWVWPDGADVGITVRQFLELVRDETLPGWMQAPSLPYVEGWYYVRETKKCGPYAIETLAGFAAAGKLRSDDVLWRHDGTGWTAIAAERVIAYPPPGSAWPIWLKEVARSEKFDLTTHLPPAQIPAWLADVKRTELQASSNAQQKNLPEWMQDIRQDGPSGKRVTPELQPGSSPGRPNWLDDIRKIEESLRRRLVLALAIPANTGPVATPPPSGPKPLSADISIPSLPVSKETNTPWPLSQDYNEAIQNPAQSFSDPELQKGEVATDALGLPVPCSGNFADVYGVQTPLSKFAVKCFTRRIPGLRERYVEITKYLKQIQLPFVVDFKFLDEGIRVRGLWYPVLKMQWVDGVPLNTYVRNNLESPQTLQMLCRMWVKLATRLTTVNLAHGDLQHGNVLLTPVTRAGSFRVRLVDYDGMCVPALDLLRPIEVGHSSYQHPRRLREGTYGLHIDRFSHLVIYTALRSLMVGGSSLWNKFDNGDNLLFAQKDFENPRTSALFRDLVKLDDVEVKKLAQALAIASQKPLEETPLLTDLVSLGSDKISSRSNNTYLIGPS